MLPVESALTHGAGGQYTVPGALPKEYEALTTETRSGKHK